MAPAKKPSGRKDRQAGNPAGRVTPAGRNRLTKRKIGALLILIVLPLGLIAGALGSIGSGSKSASSGSADSVTPPGLDLMTQACTQLSTLAENAGAVAATTTTTPGTKTPTAGGTTTTTDNGAAAANLLAGMQKVAQLANDAAAASSTWQPMASDISKLNSMLQSDTGDNASFSTQLDTVGQECSAVVGSTSPSTPAGTSP
jgi:hypothetical protein